MTDTACHLNTCVGIRARSGVSFHSDHLILTTSGRYLIRAGSKPVTDRFLIASLLSHTVLSHWEVLPSALTMTDKGKFYSVKISVTLSL